MLGWFYGKIPNMKDDNMNDNDDLFDYLLNVADSIDIEGQMEEIAERSMIELKEELFMPIYDEYYGGRVVNQFVFDEKGVKKPLKDPKGGLTAAGRAYFKRTEGANLKPGVRGPANTPEKMRRKGSFLTRFFTNPSGPMKDEKGRATRLALSAAAWGEPVPKDASDAAKLAAKGRRLLERYAKTKKKSATDSGLETKSYLLVDDGPSPLDEIDLKGIGYTPAGLFAEEMPYASSLVRRISTKSELAMRHVRAKNKAVSMSKNTKERMSDFVEFQTRRKRNEKRPMRSAGKNKRPTR